MDLQPLRARSLLLLLVLIASSQRAVGATQVSRPVQWTVYVRGECSLCEAMLIELAQLLGDEAAGVAVVDITGDSKLEDRYGQRVPVLLADGDFVCAYRLDHGRFRSCLAGA